MGESLWARVVYDFLLAYRLRTINRGHLLGALTPLYLAWVASHILITEGGTDPEKHIEAQAAAFEADKAYLVSRWRWAGSLQPISHAEPQASVTGTTDKVQELAMIAFQPDQYPTYPAQPSVWNHMSTALQQSVERVLSLLVVILPGVLAFFFVLGLLTLLGMLASYIMRARAGGVEVRRPDGGGMRPTASRTGRHRTAPRRWLAAWRSGPLCSWGW